MLFGGNIISIAKYNREVYKGCLLYNEKIVLFVGNIISIAKYNREVYKGAIKKGYCHYINAETVYSCYTQYRNGSCVASAANSSLHYFDQDSNLSLYYLLYNTMIKKTVFHYVFV